MLPLAVGQLVFVVTSISANANKSNTVNFGYKGFAGISSINPLYSNIPYNQVKLKIMIGILKLTLL